MDGRWSCSICNGDLNDGRHLDCLHSICGRCFESHTIVTCFRCQTKTRIVQELQADFLAADFIGLQQLQGSSSPVCDECDDGEEATHRCVDCQLFYCSLHQRAHAKSKKTQTHSVVEVSALRTEGNPAVEAQLQQPDLSIARKPLCCAAHGKEVELFCATCRQCVCRDCVLVAHKTHSYSFIAEVDGTTSLTKHVANAQKSASTVQQTLKKVKASQNLLTGNFQKANTDIERTTKELKELLDRRAGQLRAGVDAVYQKKCVILEKQELHLQSLYEGLAFGCDFAKFSEENGSKAECLSMESIVDRRLGELIWNAGKQSTLAEDDGSLAVSYDISTVRSAISICGDVISAPSPRTSKLTSTRQKCHIGQPVRLEIAMAGACDGNSIPVDGRYLKLQIKGPRGTVMPRTDTFIPGKRVCEFTPKPNPGDYRVEAHVNGIHITGSPLVLPVAESVFKFAHVLSSNPAESAAVKIEDNGFAVNFDYPCREMDAPQQQQPFGMVAPQPGYDVVTANAAIQLEPKKTVKWSIRYHSLGKYGGERDARYAKPLFGFGILWNTPAVSRGDFKARHGSDSRYVLSTAIAQWSSGATTFFKEPQGGEKQAEGLKFESGGLFHVECRHPDTMIISSGDCKVVREVSISNACVVTETGEASTPVGMPYLGKKVRASGRRGTPSVLQASTPVQPLSWEPCGALQGRTVGFWSQELPAGNTLSVLPFVAVLRNQPCKCELFFP